MWLLLISVLQKQCVLDLPRFIDGLWTNNLNKHLVENMAGSIAFKTSGYGCTDKYIYTAQYSSNKGADQYSNKPLSSLVDINTWEKIKEDNITETFQDKEHEYVIYNTSDGVYMKVYDL